jgi:hypothetical protein
MLELARPEVMVRSVGYVTEHFGSGVHRLEIRNSATRYGLLAFGKTTTTVQVTNY